MPCRRHRTWHPTLSQFTDNWGHPVFVLYIDEEHYLFYCLRPSSSCHPKRQHGYSRCYRQFYQICCRSPITTPSSTTLVEKVYLPLGIPSEVHTDQGTDFESHLFKRVNTLLGQLLSNQKMFTQPSTHEANILFSLPQSKCYILIGRWSVKIL